MGGTQSFTTEEQVTVHSSMLTVLEHMGADITIDSTLVGYSGLNSASVLNDYSSDVLSSMVSKGPSVVAGLGSSLAALNSVPNAVGIGALVISIALDLAVVSLGMTDSDSPLNMVRRVFAEEKALGVRDTMDEYLNRLQMHMKIPTQALEETKRLEQQLSNQLTILRNSMLKDDQKNIHFIKYWTNGAAFHSQMLIHGARIKMAILDSNLNNHQRKENLAEMADSITTKVGQYQQDLRQLLRKLYPISKIDLGPKLSEEDVDRVFSSWKQSKQLTDYFANLKKNMNTLIMQRQTFKLPAIAG